MKVAQLFESIAKNTTLLRGVFGASTNFGKPILKINVTFDKKVPSFSLFDEDNTTPYTIEVYKVEPRTGTRKSLGGSGVVQSFMRALPGWKDIPNREFSTFCTTEFDHAENFGDSMAILVPPDDAVLAQKTLDWNHRNYDGTDKLDLNDIGEILEILNLPPLAIETINELPNVNGKSFSKFLATLKANSNALGKFYDVKVRSDEYMKISTNEAIAIAKCIEDIVKSLDGLMGQNTFDMIDELKDYTNEHFKATGADKIHLNFLKNAFSTYVSNLAALSLYASTKFYRDVNSPRTFGISLVTPATAKAKRGELWFEGEYIMIVGGVTTMEDIIAKGKAEALKDFVKANL